MKIILPEELIEKLAAKEQVAIIDVREVDELASGHIPGIIHIPLGLLEFKMQDLHKNTPYIMVCRSGGRSGQATAFLESYGYDVTNLSGGMLNWDGPVEG